MIEAVPVTGLTLTQAERVIHRRYIESKILAKGNDRIIVTLMRKRTNQVLVVREDSGASQPVSNMMLVGPSKRGSVFAVDLPSDESDVMHALAESGGLPGLDAKNEVIILRGKFADAIGRDMTLRELSMHGEYVGPQQLMGNQRNVLRIPLRAEPGMPRPQWTQEDIRLQTGDIVFIETREREVFYTGGILGGRELPLPRDYDLDVLAAISLAGGSAATGVTGGSAGSGNGLSGGGRGGSSGLIPATQIIVVRRLPTGTTVPIRIDLNRAIVHPADRILVQPGDYVILQYKPLELAANVILGNVGISYFINGINR
jgi:protein involved in polysaccharide export with SLBB domain